jgi:hypothetical protein
MNDNDETEEVRISKGEEDHINYVVLIDDIESTSSSFDAGGLGAGEFDGELNIWIERYN